MTSNATGGYGDSVMIDRTFIIIVVVIIRHLYCAHYKLVVRTSVHHKQA